MTREFDETIAEHMPHGDKRGRCDYCGEENRELWIVETIGDDEHWCGECMDWLSLPIGER